MSAAQTWAAALIVALLLGVSYRLDGPDDVQAAQDMADHAETVGVKK